MLLILLLLHVPTQWSLLLLLLGSIIPWVGSRIRSQEGFWLQIRVLNFFSEGGTRERSLAHAPIQPPSQQGHDQVVKINSVQDELPGNLRGS